jgi:tetratricopeptide (TPR) repeat protein
MTHIQQFRFLAAAAIALVPSILVAPPAMLLAQPAPAEPAPTTRTRFSRNAESEIRFQEGLLQYSRRQLPQAEANFQALVKEDPADAEAYYYLGLAQLDQGKPNEAIQSFNQSVRLDPTSDEVLAARATALIRAKRFDEAEKDLRVLEADPRWESLSAYLRGQLLLGKGDLEGAAASFKKARVKGEAESLPAGYFEGLTYLRMRQIVRARQTFREASVGAEGDATITSAARQLDEILLRQERAARRLQAQLSLAYEYDSNVIQLGSDIVTAAGISDEADSRLLVRPRASYQFIKTPRLSGGLEGYGYFTWHDDLQGFNIASYSGGPFVNYRVTDNFYASARYAYNHLEFGHEQLLGQHIATPQLTLVQPKFGYTSAFYQYQGRTAYNDPVNPAFDLEGDVHVFGVVQGVQLPQIFSDAGSPNLELSYRYSRYDTDGTEFEGDIHTAGATLYSPLPFWELRGDVGVSVSFEQGDSPSVLDASDDPREELEWSVTAGVTRQLSTSTALRVDYTFTKHDANVTTAADQSPYDYDRHLVGVRLILTY